MALIEVDEENFFQELNCAFDANQMVIVKFGSEFCEPCHALECELEEIEEEHENITILSVDTDESAGLAEKYDVFQLPTMVIYRDRETVIYHKEGVLLAQDIEKILTL